MLIKSLLLAFAVILAAFHADLPPETDVKAAKVLEVAGYTEGVVVDSDGAIYISDVYNGTIYRVAADGVAKVWAKTGAPNGHKILPDGTHLVCDGSQHAVLHLDAAGKIIGKAAAEYDGKPLRSPNDLTLDPRGGFYFTDPGGSNLENSIGTVHYVDVEGKTHLVAEGLAFPNGIALRPDGKTLLVGESKHNRILSYDIISPGKAGKMRVFAKLPVREADQIANEPDGMCLDAAGNLYVAHYGMRQVQVLSPEGKLLRRYGAGNLTTSNVAFGGPGMDQLYVTGALGDEKKTKGGLFRLDLKGVKGLKFLQSAAPPVYEVSRTSTAIKVDGKLDDPAWSKAPGTGRFINNSDGSAASYETEARILYDDKYLYFSFRCRDENIWSTLEHRDARLWEEEVVEVFLQADPSQPSYIELEVNPLGTMLDIYLLDVRKPLRYESWNSGNLQWAVDVDGSVDGKAGDREWTCELALPLEDVVTAPRLPPRPGDRWRLNLYRVESRPVPALLAWSPTWKDDFHLPGMFGWMVFTDRQVP
ncbi:MAG: carbohydrate-binding family 9-like protein [Pyrinomonadaceae bacterium]|nr:carbohydrate-binding family 9-like protein [Pyrinomonadaceae bacterium]